MKRKLEEILEEKLNEILGGDSDKLQTYVERFIEAYKNKDRRNMQLYGDEVKFLIDKLSK